jgi:hypothetical protein
LGFLEVIGDIRDMISPFLRDIGIKFNFGGN